MILQGRQDEYDLIRDSAGIASDARRIKDHGIMIAPVPVYMDITLIINETLFLGKERDQPFSWFALEGETAPWRGRVAYAQYWEALFKVMEDKFRRLAEAHFRLYKAMQEWHNRIGDMNDPGNPDTCAQPTAPSVAISSNPTTSPTISSSPKSSAINSWDLALKHPCRKEGLFHNHL
jgi:hypothetical protein